MFLSLQLKPQHVSQAMKKDIFTPDLVTLPLIPFSERLAALEGGEACIATSSGMGAYTLLCLGVLGEGDHVVLSRNMFGTHNNFV